MHRVSDMPAMRAKLLLTVAAVTMLIIPIPFCVARANLFKSQAPPAALNLSDFKFDIVSIKPNKAFGENFGYKSVPDGLSLTHYSLQMLIKDAFGIYEDYRYSGAPGWIHADRYDIEARVDNSTADQLQKLRRADRILVDQHMLQALLAERFGLRIHRETKEFPVYFLVVAKGGPKLQESKPNPDDPNAPTNASWGGTVRGPLTISTAKGVPTEELASVLSRSIGRMVLDKTGLTGKYDFTLQYVREQIAVTTSAEASDSSDTSIFKALQDQLGLKLESGKGPVEIIVIDHVERASGN
jgi:uncharacterized protein (TIGR03435 family)